MDRRDFSNIAGIATVGTVVLGNSLILQKKKLIKFNNNNPVFTIYNKNRTEAKTAMLFGTIKDLTDANKDKDIEIKVQGSSHQEMKEFLFGSPLLVKGIVLKTNNTINFEKTIQICGTNNVGFTTQMPYSPLNYRGARDKDEKQIDGCLDLILTPEVYIYFNITPRSYIQAEFLISKEKKITHMLQKGSISQFI